MKKVLISLAVIIGLLLVALLVLPIFFKGDILHLIERKSSRYIRADLTIGDVSLSMFKRFPNLNVVIKNVAIVGKDEFAQDTIAYIPLFEASVNLKSLIWGDEIIVNKMLLKDCKLAPTVAVSGKANWDILISGEADTTTTEPASGSDKKIQLNDISAENLSIVYNDYQSSMYAGVADMDLHLAGNFSETHTLLKVLLNLQNISFRQQNIAWVNNTNLNWNAEVEANLKDMAFELQKSDMTINDLKLDLTGGVAIIGERYKVNLKLNAPDTKFESLLALVPKELQKHIEGLKTTGGFNLTATTAGEYYTDHLPAFDVKFVVTDASLKYPELPESIHKINIDLNINNPGGPVDSTVLDFKKMSFTIANNPFDMHLNVANPNDPALNGGAKGTINFANLKNALPLKDITLQGMVTADLTFNGKYQYIEKEQYEKFIAKGSVVLKDILFENADFPKGIAIPQGSVTITPEKLNLSNLQAKIYSSDFTLQGSISNYLPYIFKNGTLGGSFALSSNLIDLNEFMAASPATPVDTATKKQEPAKGSAAEGALEIPKNIDLKMTTNVQKILFDNLVVSNVKGSVGLKQAVATLENLKMDMLDGTMILNGKYSTADPKVPKVDFGLDVADFDIHSAYNAFSFIKNSIPIAMNCNGKVSSSMKFSAILDKEMSPIMNTANGGGHISSKGILINDNPAMNQLAGLLNNEELSRLSISSLKIDFKLENGNIILDPFKTTLAGNPVTISGSQTVEGKLAYDMSMNIDRKYFGKQINDALKAIPGSGNIQNLDIDVKVEGTLNKPTVKPDLSKAIKTVTEEATKELKNKATEGIKKGLEKLFK